MARALLLEVHVWQWSFRGGMCHDLAGGEMVRVSVRILLLLAVLAAGRAVISGFIQADGRKEVIVVVMPGGECTPDAPAVDDSRED